MSWVYLNGALLPAAEARISAADGALLHGRGLFETFRARGGAVYLLERHLARLRAGAEVLGIAPPVSLDEVAGAVRKLTARCGLADARVRLTLTAGAPGGRPVLLIQAAAAKDYPETLYQRGAAAAIASVRRNETSPLTRVKSLQYLENLLAREEARRVGADEALFLNTRGSLVEGGASNVFLVHDGAVLTPPVTDGALPGVTRGALLELASRAGLAAREASLSVDALRRADEAFLTNAVAGVLPLVSVDGAPIGTGAPGAVTRRLRALYNDAVAALRAP